MRVPKMHDDGVIAAYKDQALRMRRRLLGVSLVVDADDVAQEAYVRFVARGAGAKIRDIRAYLAQTSTNVVIDAYRQERRHSAWDHDLAGAKGESYPDEQFAAVLLKQVIASLPEKQRHVFLLNRFSGLSYPEIAARLGISVKTVESRMSKALAHCVALLRD
jgi:RNA polymerase sigma factor (sigma-70 family)